MSQRFPWVKITSTTVGLMAAGYLLMKTTVPTDKELYDAMSPDIQRKVDAMRAARLARESATRRQVEAQANDPDSEKPVWAHSRKS
ncbi:hypothetical protein JAAARDRAFT_32979 [Jaapia argillacea MUCL 33604]|uniref:Cytochrome b mRNA-processing protein 4 n=1 Tax=Jaapia argillacea MUCL 33604 TaxID=933084 RepID=A0A067QA38_9AGAM|nr:hypothetical protein JAAARDRAFT_32979 [Jaapia argillacea MUCL 33604]